MLLGFVLMAGDGSTETVFNPGIFSARRITAAPVISFLGFVFMIAAILCPAKGKENGDKSGKDDIRLGK